MYPLEPTFVWLTEVPVELLTLNVEDQCPLGNPQVAPQLLGLLKVRGESLKLSPLIIWIQ